jgi:hypothetical protein
MASNGSQPQIIRIGRSKSNDFVLDHGKVSSRHCQLSIYGDGNYVLEDLGSTNGIYVNGRKVQIQRVGLTDKVTLGRDVSLDLARVIGSASRPAVREPVTPPGGIDLRAKSDITIGRKRGNGHRRCAIRVKLPVFPSSCQADEVMVRLGAQAICQKRQRQPCQWPPGDQSPDH